MSSGSCPETPTGSPIGQGRVGVPYVAAEAWEALRSRRLLAQFTSQKERPRRDSAGICHILRGTDISLPGRQKRPQPSLCENRTPRRQALSVWLLISGPTASGHGGNHHAYGTNTSKRRCRQGWHGHPHCLGTEGERDAQLLCPGSRTAGGARRLQARLAQCSRQPRPIHHRNVSAKNHVPKWSPQHKSPQRTEAAGQVNPPALLQGALHSRIT